MAGILTQERRGTQWVRAAAAAFLFFSLFVCYLPGAWAETASDDVAKALPETGNQVQERLKEIRAEVDSLLERKDAILAEGGISEEDFRRLTVALGSLENAYSRHSGALDALRQAREDAASREAKEGSFLKKEPPFNLSFYEEVRNQFESAEQKLNATVTAIKLHEGTVSSLETARSQAEARLSDLKKSGAEGFSPGKKWALREAEADLETLLISLKSTGVNMEAQKLRKDFLQVQKDMLGKDLEKVRKNLVYDEQDRKRQADLTSEKIARVRERMEALQAERDRSRSSLARSQGELNSARTEKEQELARAAVSEREAQFMLAQASLTEAEQEILRLSESQKVWEDRYSLIREQPGGQKLWDLRSTVNARLKEMENSFRILTQSQAGIQADILAAQKELEGRTGAVAARLKGRIEALNRTSEVAIAGFSKLFALFGQYNRLLEEVSERIDTVRIAEKVTSFGRERFLAFWNVKLWSGEGYSVTVAKLALAVLLFAAAFLLSGRMTLFLKRKILVRFGMDPTGLLAGQKIIFYILMGSFILLALDVLGIPLTAFAFLGGALAIALGFGAQNIFNNLISGFIIMFDKPIRVNDLVELEGISGIVEEIGSRSTRIKTFDNVDVLLPNSYFLSNKIVNWTHTDRKIRVKMTASVKYGSPVREVERLLLLTATEHTRVLKHPEPLVFFNEFGPSSMDFVLYFWIDMANAVGPRVASDIRFRLVSLFGEKEIEFAFPQMDVRIEGKTPRFLFPTGSGEESNPEGKKE